MASNNATLLLLAGAGALLLATGGKKKKKGTEKEPDVPADVPSEDLDDDDEEEEEEEDLKDLPKPPTPELSRKEILERNVDPEGKARLGMLYQIRLGDTPLEVCREALFGSRAAVSNPVMRQAAKDLLVRIDCGPWNQAAYGVPLDNLKEGHANIIHEYFTTKGVSYDPIYSNNAGRILNGQKVTSSPGGDFALIWIPMIDIDRLDTEGIVTTEGVYHPDTIHGMGESAIDPPPEIKNLGFEEVSSTEVGCELPEGDFRTQLVADE